MLSKESYKGYFFLPNLPDHKVFGEISFGPETSTRLELFGSFFKEVYSLENDQSQDAIWGYLYNGQKVCLINCKSIQWSLNFGGYNTVVYNAQTIFTGIHLRNHEEKKFNAIYAEFDYFYDWLKITGQKVIFSNDYATINLEYNRPDNIEFTLEDQFKCEFLFSNNFPTGRGFNLVTNCTLKLTPFSTCNFKDLQHALWKFALMLSFLTLNKVRINSLTLNSEDAIQKINNDQTVHNDIAVYYKQSSTEISETDYTRFLLSYKDLSAGFELFINNWFNMQEDLSPIINTLYKHLGEFKQFSESDFLSIVQAVEAFHRRKIQDTENLKKNSKFKKEEIYNKLSSEEDITWLKEKLAFSYEPSLRVRLIELFELTKDVLFVNPSEAEISKIISKIVATRNYYTHFEEKLERRKAHSGQMLDYSKLLRNVLIVMILKSLNISESLLNTAIKDNMKFRLR